jgi:hypothetical protein
MRTGRPSTLTLQLQADFVRYLEAGNYLDVAAQLCGVSRKTVNLWERRGRRQKRGKYRDFLDAVKKAEGRVETRNLLIIAKAAEKHWQAAAWWLERRNPQRWMRKERRELTGADGKKLTLDAAAADDASKRALAKALAIDVGADPKRAARAARRKR